MTLTSTTTFTEILALTNQEELTLLLTVSSPVVQQFGLWLLQKATAVSEVDIIASWSDAVKTLIRVLLLDDDTGVASKATDVLVGLLSVDLSSKGGTGLLWRRVLEDKGVYELFFKLCSWKGDELPGGKKSKTQGQGRLLGLVARMVALDLECVATSKFPEIDAKYTDGEACKGLLEFAAKYAVDAEGDVMMHMVLLDFYTSLLQEPDSAAGVASKALNYLEASGLHGSTVGRYLAPGAYSNDFIDQQFLESKAAEYIAKFTSLHPTQLLSSSSPIIPNRRNAKGRRISLGTSPPAPAKPLVDSLLERIQSILEQNLPHPHSPSLDILSALPASVLVTDAGKQVVAMIPITPPFTEYIDALANVLFKQGSGREVYNHYFSTHRGMWKKLVSYASALALRDVVLSCMRFIEKIVVTQDSTGSYWGLKEVVNTPGLMPFLITPPQRFAGSARDPMSAAFTAATRKLEVLQTILRVLRRAGDEVPGGEGWKVVVEERVRVGLWGNAAGGEVATMEV